MKIKAFAFDLDGTLLLPDGSGPHPETMKALREANKEGYKLILATGRPIYQTMDFVNSIGCISYIVGNNGASLYDVEANENISKDFLPEELFKSMIEVAKETKSFFVMSTTDHVKKLNFFDGDDVPEWIKISVNDFGEPDKLEDVIASSKTDKITQLTIKNEHELIVDKAHELKKEYGKDYALHIANEVYLDVNPKGVSKLTGIEIVLEEHGIKPGEVMTFGDSGNDIQMLKGSGYGVAMENANDGAKTVADEIIGHHSTDAIAIKIREVIDAQTR
ncbi:HAD family hydrolase [Mycoplasma todarodis]|uniref:HAD family hydrolase n=1 Tax=Mycoplasma todarodis TaxID=1937191 RepID=UPI003B2BE1D9